MEIALSLNWPLDLDRAGREIVNQEIDRGLHEIAAEFERRIRILTPVGVGGGSGLQGSIAGEVRGLPAREAVIGTPVVYGAVVEHGRNPGPISQAGVDAIELWVRRKLGVPDDKAHAVALAIAWKIRKKGFKGAHMFQRAFDAGQGMLQTESEKIGERIAARLSGRGPGGAA